MLSFFLRFTTIYMKVIKKKVALSFLLLTLHIFISSFTSNRSAFLIDPLYCYNSLLTFKSNPKGVTNSILIDCGCFRICVKLKCIIKQQACLPKATEKHQSPYWHSKSGQSIFDITQSDKRHRLQWPLWTTDICWDCDMFKLLQPLFWWDVIT